MKTHTFILITMLALLSISTFAADRSSSSGSGFDWRKKVERKQESRWNLQDWLAQRDRNRMMDLWLAMYAPSPYEYFLGGSYQNFATVNETNKTEKSYSGSTAYIGAYATVIGLEGFYENNSEEKISQSGGSLNLRIVGNAVQGTHLIINYGYRSMNTQEPGAATIINQSFAGADLNLYLTRYFGISGAYRSYTPVQNEFLGDVSGNRTEGGVFVDFSAIRVFGSWYSDKQTNKINDVETTTNRTGVMSGLKIFF